MKLFMKSEIYFSMLERIQHYIMTKVDLEMKDLLCQHSDSPYHVSA